MEGTPFQKPRTADGLFLKPNPSEDQMFLYGRPGSTSRRASPQIEPVAAVAPKFFSG
jgi:hypothetical protein